MLKFWEDEVRVGVVVFEGEELHLRVVLISCFEEEKSCLEFMHGREIELVALAVVGE